MSEDILNAEENISNQLEEYIEILLNCKKKRCLFCKRKNECRKFIRMGLAAVMMILINHSMSPTDENVIRHMFS